MGLVTRHPLPAAICALAFAITGGVFVFARPEYRPPQQGESITIPDKQPAHDAAGRAGWVWPDGVPGWEAGYTIKGYPVAQIQAVETESAQLAAAHMGLDAEKLRVLVAEHAMPGEGPLAIFAAPMLYESQHRACLAAALPRESSVTWLCPGATIPGPDIARSHVLVAAASYDWSSASVPVQEALQLVGVARGDVYRVVLHFPTRANPKTLRDMPLYERGKTWGQFQGAFVVPRVAGVPELQVYGRKRLVETVQLDLKPGDERVIQ